MTHDTSIKKRKFLRHIHYFRAFAIINVLILHLWLIPQQNYHHDAYQLVYTIKEMLFHSATFYFVFISGFLFSYLSFKFDIKKYYKGKLFNVILPYIIISLLYIFFMHRERISGNSDSIGEWLYKIGKLLITGDSAIQLWYIPFISIIFVASPLLLRIPEKTFKYIVIICSFIPLVVSRTFSDLTIQQFWHFLPMYLIGMYVATHYDYFLNLIHKFKALFILTAILTSGYLAYLYHTNSYMNTIGITRYAESLFYIQKVALTGLALILLQKLLQSMHPLKMLKNHLLKLIKQ